MQEVRSDILEICSSSNTEATDTKAICLIDKAQKSAASGIDRQKDNILFIRSAIYFTMTIFIGSRVDINNSMEPSEISAFIMSRDVLIIDRGRPTIIKLIARESRFVVVGLTKIKQIMPSRINCVL